MDKRNFVYKHTKKYEIRYADVDVSGRLRLSSLISLRDESACLSANELGFGYDAIMDTNLGFILVGWHIEMYRMPHLEEELTIVTWPLAPVRFTLFRDFELFSGDEKIGVASSRWCIVDLNNFSLKPAGIVFEKLNLNLSFNDFRSVDVSSWKIPKITEGEKRYDRVMLNSDYDHYNHVNNAKYPDYLTDAFSVEELKMREIKCVKINYAKQCKEGEVLTLYRQKTGDETYLVEARVGDEIRCQMEVAFL